MKMDHHCPNPVGKYYCDSEVSWDFLLKSILYPNLVSRVDCELGTLRLSEWAAFGGSWDGLWRWGGSTIVLVARPASGGVQQANKPTSQQQQFAGSLAATPLDFVEP